MTIYASSRLVAVALLIPALVAAACCEEPRIISTGCTGAPAAAIPPDTAAQVAVTCTVATVADGDTTSTVVNDTIPDPNQ